MDARHGHISRWALRHRRRSRDRPRISSATAHLREADAPPRILHLTRNPEGLWEVELADRQTTVACELLEDAERVAYLCAAHGQPCELLIHDNRAGTTDHELIDQPTPVAGRPHES